MIGIDDSFLLATVLCRYKMARQSLIVGAIHVHSPHPYRRRLGTKFIAYK